MSPYLMFGAIAVLGTMARRSRPTGRSGIDHASPPSNPEGQYNRNARASTKRKTVRNCSRCRTHD
jgi:hypothetical protein